MNIMDRARCINIVNVLQEFNLITPKQALSIVNKRDKQEKRGG